MARFSEGFLRGISNFGRMDPTEPARRLQQATPSVYQQMGTTDPLARRVGSLFSNLGVDTSYMQTGEERAQAAMKKAGEQEFASPEARMIAMLEAQLPTLRPAAQMQAMDQIRQLRDIERQRAAAEAEQRKAETVDRGKQNLVKLASSPEFKFSDPKQKADYLSMARAYGVEPTEALQLYNGLKTVPKDVDTATVDRVKPDGTTETILYNKQTGEDIRNLGVTGREEPETPNVITQKVGDIFVGIDKQTGEQLWSVDTQSEAEALEQADKIQRTKLAFLQERDSQIAKIDKALDIIASKGDIGLYNRMTAKVAQDPDSVLLSGLFPEYVTLKDTVDSVKASLGLDTIKELKKASPSGSTGLGPVSNIELQALQSKIQTLNSANLVDLPNTLNAIKQHYNNIHKLNSGQAPDINWDDPEYQNLSVVKDGVRYVTLDGGESWAAL
jgi:hypothetical protein